IRGQISAISDAASLEPSIAGPKLELTTSRDFVPWLAERRASLAFTTYQAGQLFVLGVSPEGRLSVVEGSFERWMGRAGTAQTLGMSAHYQLWRFENALEPGQTHDGHDRLY